MPASDDLEAIAAAAERHAAPEERLEAVLPAEPTPGERTYLCAFAGPGGRSWLALDADVRPVTSRSRVREAVSITAMCELAEERAGGGELEELRKQLLSVRMTENPPGIDEAEAAALALESTIAGSPRVATPAYLDDISAAARRLERALGNGSESPFASAMHQAVGVVNELAREVESQSKLPLV